MKKKKRRGARLFPRIILVLAVILAAVILVLGIGRIFKKDRGSGASAGESAAESQTDGGSEAAGAGLSAGAAGGAENAGAGLSAGAAAAAEDADAVPSAEDADAVPSAEDADAVPSAEDATAGTTAAPEKPAYDHTATELEEGREYLRLLDERSPMEIQEMIAEARREYQRVQALKAYAAEREAYLEEIEEGGMWEAFSDYVILGDSRVVGFELYGFLSPERVIAESGDTINSITDSLDLIRACDPKYIYLSYGINDIGAGLWPSADYYADDYERQINVLRETFPDAVIYVNSILPVTQGAVEGTPLWGGLPEYSEAVRRMCERNEIAFIDNDALAQIHGDLYEQDGVHFQPDFYYYWAENQLLAIFDGEHGYLTFRDPSPGAD